MDVTDGPFIVQNIPGTKCIMISKKKEYEQDLDSFGMQFERHVTGRGLLDTNDCSTVEHLHVIQVGKWVTLFIAEVDSYDDFFNIVEVKAINEKYWRTKVMFQMISNGSTKLCHGKKQREKLLNISLRDLSIVAENALHDVDFKILQENILSCMDSIRTQVTDVFPYKILFGRNGLELQREDSIVLFPPKQVTTRLINGNKEIRDLMLPLTLEEEAVLSKVTNVNYRLCLDS